jgi:pyruvate/2-oxoglutarate dehydrogenase complex dihydrolipoamide dehydrogenase (E3) component
VCVGRQPLSAGIGLETIGLRTDARGWIPADDYLQTGAEGVFAIGDILGPEKIMLAHVASMEGMAAAENALGGHLIGAHATELIGEATLAFQLGAGIEELTRTIHAHPTLSEIMLETALKLGGRSLHG